MLQSPGPATTVSTHPSSNVVVGSGFVVGSPPDGQLMGMSGQWQISVCCGPTVVYTVAVGEHCSWPGSDVWRARTAAAAAALVHVGQLLQPGLSKTWWGGGGTNAR